MSATTRSHQAALRKPAAAGRRKARAERRPLRVRGYGRDRNGSKP